MKLNKKKLEYLLKHNAAVQFVYKHTVSFVLRFIGLFIKTDEKMMLFSSFGGRKYNDSPKVIFERMLSDDRFVGYKYFWAFENPDDFHIQGATCIKIDTWQYFKIALKSKVWITSVNIERGLKFKKKKTVYINTWHGAGTKKIGNACSARKDYDFSNVNVMLVQSNFEKEIFVRDFNCNCDSIYMIGFPRNDELFHIDGDKRREVKARLGIAEDKKVILYAPTWRDSNNGGLSYEFVSPIHIEKWKSRLHGDYVFLFRMHAFTTRFDMTFDDVARDVSSYENLNHILAAADVVITDYSTIVYDCAIADKPFICFGFDYDRYRQERGFYFDLNTEYPGGVIKDEDEVIDRVVSVISGADRNLYSDFRKKYIEAGGNATNTVIDRIYELLSTNGKPII